MKSKILEIFGIPVGAKKSTKWKDVVIKQQCPYLNRKCLKNRKSQPDVAIGTCSLQYGKDEKCIIICPHRLLERKQIFADCLHLLTLHEPGNEIHLVSEISIPGGSVDYFLASVRDGKAIDFVGIELQTLDTTGTVWPERQRLMSTIGVRVKARDMGSGKSFGMNWKMTAKTVLVQLHHKISTFESIHKHLVLVVQDYLMEYMRSQFSFDHVSSPRLGDPMHFHSYQLRKARSGFRIHLVARYSTDANGIAGCLGLKADANIDLKRILNLIESKISDDTLVIF